MSWIINDGDLHANSRARACWCPTPCCEPSSIPAILPLDLELSVSPETDLRFVHDPPMTLPQTGHFRIFNLPESLARTSSIHAILLHLRQKLETQLWHQFLVKVLTNWTRYYRLALSLFDIGLSEANASFTLFKSPRNTIKWGIKEKLMADIELRFRGSLEGKLLGNVGGNEAKWSVVKVWESADWWIGCRCERYA